MSDDDHEHRNGSHFSDVELRARALESLLVDQQLVNPETLDKLVDTFENQLGPRNGEIAAARRRAEDDDGNRYYEYWLAALEKLIEQETAR